jgi:hypothetical protein
VAKPASLVEAVAARPRPVSSVPDPDETPWAAKGSKETICQCGRRTRDKSGKCRGCRHTFPNFKTMHTGDLMRMIEAIKAELSRRREEIDAALKGAK